MDTSSGTDKFARLNFPVRSPSNMIKPVTAVTLGLLLSASAATAQTIYPIDRAAILSGAQFDFKVEFPDKVDQAKLKVTVNGQDYAAAFGRAGTFVEREDDKDQSALLL